MKCEECDGVMQWRCTNTDTLMAKYKCPHCGHIMMKKMNMIKKEEEPRKIEPPKYYHYDKASGMYRVNKIKDKRFICFGQYEQEEVAQAVVSELKQVGWDKSALPSIYDNLGLELVNRRWVWT